MFSDIFRYDLRNGLRASMIKLSAVFAAVVMIFALYCVKFRNMQDNYEYPLFVSSSDFITFLFSGSPKYDKSTGRPFDFNAIYMLFNCLVGFLTFNYPTSDLLGIGKKVLISSGNRVKWAISKMVWVCFMVALVYLFSFVACVVFCVAFSVPVNMMTSPACLAIISNEEIPASLGGECMRYIPVVILGQLSLSISVTALSTLINPVIAFMAYSGTLLTSLFYESPFIPGNSLMLVRMLNNDGKDVPFMIGFSLFLIVLSVTLLCILFKEKDIV